MNKNFVKSILGEQTLNCFDAGASYFLTDNWAILLNSLAAKLYLADPNSECLNYIPEAFCDYVNIIPYKMPNTLSIIIPKICLSKSELKNFLTFFKIKSEIKKITGIDMIILNILLIIS